MPLCLFKRGAALLLLMAGPGWVAGADAACGNCLELRLQQEVNSYSSQVGDRVRAVLTAGYREGGAERVVVGFVRETAALPPRFTELETGPGVRVAIASRVVTIDNARERLDGDGRIRRICLTSTPGFRASGLLASLVAVDPIARAFSTAAFAALLRFSELEIRLQAGTELLVELREPLPLAPLPLLGLPAPVPAALLERLPYRTHRAERRVESNITNLNFAGEPAAIERAFLAAGWQMPESWSAAKWYRTLCAMAENQEDKEAPMSLLLLEGETPVPSWAKALNTFAKRHHLRVYLTEKRCLERLVFTAAATQDASMNFSRGRELFTQWIDETIDRERSKLVSELVVTGRVALVGLERRALAPEEAWNATGQNLLTDRQAAVLIFNSCLTGRQFDEEAAEASGPHRGNRVARIARQTVLTFRDDIYRGSLWWQGASIITRGMRRYRSSRSALRPVTGPTIMGRRERSTKKAGDAAKWEPLSVELTLRVGAMVFCNFPIGAERQPVAHPHRRN
jgi:hypothetical protein